MTANPEDHDLGMSLLDARQHPQCLPRVDSRLAQVHHGDGQHIGEYIGVSWFGQQAGCQTVAQADHWTIALPIHAVTA